MHRFWIEAEEIDISMLDEAGIQKNLTRISLGNLKMVVKKHRMERDIHGNLQDVGNEDEGWPIYVLTAQQMQELQRGIRAIDGHAMIFIYAEQRLFFWENNEIIQSHAPTNYRETLIRIFKQPKDQNGLVAKNTKNMPLMYRATKEMTRQAGLSHRYSSEFIFAHEFTTHYDEFAQYLPEFGRLKELSKISSLIRILDGMRSSNKECTEALDYILSPSSKQAAVRSQMTELFSSHLSSLSSCAYGRLIDSFMSGNINPLADALLNHEKTKAQQDIKKQFPTSSINDIALALDNPNHAAVIRIATEESHRQLREQKVVKDNLETGFVRINLGKHDEPVDLEGKCLWVPASVRHDVRRDDATGLTRYSFFVYGGVSVQPRINMVAGGGWAVRGNSVGSGSINSLNAQAAMNNKLRALQKAQNTAVRTEQLGDGRVRYYAAERKSSTHGPTRGNAHVTEHNPKTGQVRAWAESYDHQGNVNRVHPKMVNGQTTFGQHYPPTGAEIRHTRGFK